MDEVCRRIGARGDQRDSAIRISREGIWVGRIECIELGVELRLGERSVDRNLVSGVERMGAGDVPG